MPDDMKEAKYDSKDYDSGRVAKQLDAQSLIELMEIAEKLKKAMQMGDQQTLKGMEHNKALLAMLAEYLIANIDNPNIDQELLVYIQKFLGVNLSKKKEKDKELEEEREEELTEEQKKHKQRMAIYEIYKAMNPNRIAGETQLENFINNVQVHGMKTALKNEGKEYAVQMNTSELGNLQSNANKMQAAVRQSGAQKGGGMSR